MNDKIQDTIRERRNRYAEEGNVVPEELVADIFAAYAVGKESMISALKLLRESRKKERPYDETTPLAVKEFNNRIRALKNISDENLLRIFYEVFEEYRILR